MYQGRNSNQNWDADYPQENNFDPMGAANEVQDEDAWLEELKVLAGMEPEPQKPAVPQNPFAPGQAAPQMRPDPRQVSPQTGGQPHQVPPQMNAQPRQMPPQMGGQPRQMPPQMGSRPQQMPPQMGGRPRQMPPQMGGRPQQMPPQMGGGPRQMPPQMGGQPRQMPPQMGGRPQQMPPQMGGRPQQMPPQMGARPQQVPPQIPEAAAAEQAPRKRSHTGGLIFYTLFFGCILAIYIVAYGLLGDLQEWLVRYEAAQPTRKCQEVFSQYFENPNWGQLYDLAGIQQSTYEGKDAFAAYMDQRVAGQKLTYLETSAGLSKDKKYIVRLGDEKIASFTLTDKNQAVEVTDIPDWQLGTIDLFFEGSGVYYIETMAGYTTTVNGVPLGEDAVVRMSTTKAGEYLPEGVAVPAMVTQQVSGLMTVPQIAVTNGEGKAVDVQYDEQSRTFKTSAVLADGGVGEAERDRALEALKTYAIYMSQKSGGDTKLAEYFQRGTELYKTLSSMERMWNQSYAGYSLTDESVTDCVRYNDELFSARVSVKLHLQRKDGTEKVTDIDRSMFFKKVSGKWKCYDMTAVDVSEPIEKVRLTFRTEEEILKSEMVDTTAAQIECPVVTAPEGKVFSGWMQEEIKPNGDRVMHLTLQPDASGKAAPPADMQPMVLYPLFETAAN